MLLERSKLAECTSHCSECLERAGPYCQDETAKLPISKMKRRQILVAAFLALCSPCWTERLLSSICDIWILPEIREPFAQDEDARF